MNKVYEMNKTSRAGSSFFVLLFLYPLISSSYILFLYPLHILFIITSSYYILFLYAVVVFTLNGSILQTTGPGLLEYIRVCGG